MSHTTPPRRRGPRASAAVGLLAVFVHSFILSAALDAPAAIEFGGVSWWLVTAPGHWPAMMMLTVCTALVVFLTGRLWVSIVLCWALGGILVIASTQKISFLRQPLVPADLSFVRTPELIAASADASAVARAIVFLGVLCVAAIAVGHRLAPLYTSPLRGRNRAGALRVAGAATSLCLLSPIVVHEPADNLWLRLSELGGAQWAPWSQFQNHAHNGFVAATIYALPSEPMQRPTDYDDAEVLATLPANSDDRDFVVTDNVVVVLSESFADPSLVPGLAPSRDPLHAWRALTRRAWTGWLRAPFYGTGTSAMEHQVLTAQNLAFFAPHVVSPYQQFVADQERVDSYAWWMRERGARTMAIHPYDPHFYRRDEVYPALGFEKFYVEKDIVKESDSQDRPFVSDATTFDFVLDQLRNEVDPVLAQVVTMQNHVPFPGHNEDPIDPGDGLGASESSAIGDYLRGLEKSAEALGDFLESLRSLDETTHVVYYGDHYPAIFSSAREHSDEEQWKALPTLIWSTQELRHRDIGTVSPTEVIPWLHRATRWPSPPIFGLVDDAAQEVGPFTRGDSTAGWPSDHKPLGKLRAAQYALISGDERLSRALWSR